MKFDSGLKVFSPEAGLPMATPLFVTNVLKIMLLQYFCRSLHYQTDWKMALQRARREFKEFYIDPLLEKSQLLLFFSFLFLFDVPRSLSVVAGVY
jgi:hypothetical protein